MFTDSVQPIYFGHGKGIHACSTSRKTGKVYILVFVAMILITISPRAGRLVPPSIFLRKLRLVYNASTRQGTEKEDLEEIRVQRIE